MGRYDQPAERVHGSTSVPRGRGASVDRPEMAGPAAGGRTAVGPLGPQTLAYLQRAAGNAGVAALLAEGEAPSPEAVLAGAGRPLDADLRLEMEASLGADFSTVRVHDDATAAASARALGARAYTVGDDVVVGDGGSDQRTMAHELAHVVQQRSGPVDGTPTEAGFSVSDPGDPFEQAASAAAAAISSGAGHAPGGVGSSTGSAATAQRASADEEIPDISVEDLPGGIPDVSVEDLPGGIPDVSVEDLPGGIPVVSPEDLPKAAGAAPARASAQTGSGSAPATPSVSQTTSSGAGSDAGAQAEAIRDDLDRALLGLGADPPDYQAVVAAMSAGGAKADQLAGQVERDPAAHDLATNVLDTFFIVGKDIWPKAGLNARSSDVQDALALEHAKARASKLAERLEGKSGGRSR